MAKRKIQKVQVTMEAPCRQAVCVPRISNHIDSRLKAAGVGPLVSVVGQVVHTQGKMIDDFVRASSESLSIRQIAKLCMAHPAYKVVWDAEKYQSASRSANFAAVCNRVRRHNSKDSAPPVIKKRHSA